MSAISKVLDALTAHGCDPRRSGDGWSAKCPAHEDNNPSLSVKEAAGGAVLLKDHAGCAVNTILAALPPLTLKDLFESDSGTGKKMEIAATYDYTTAEGELAFQVVRLAGLSRLANFGC
jgi:hypothetical protein